MKIVRLKFDSGSYSVHIGAGLLPRVGSLVKELGIMGVADELMIVTGPVTKELYGDTLSRSLTDSGFKVTTLIIPETEREKSLETIEKLYYQLTRYHIERTTPVLALGGGVVGDLTGFAASTYLCGIPLIQIPTTLVSQVDSSVGGKVFFDYGGLKNRVGTFYQPKLVVSDITTLRTLSPKDFSLGLAEVIKCAVVRDGELFTYLERNLDQVRSLREEPLEEIIFRSVKVKAKIVMEDERGFGLRNILNYAHTIAHALESASDFSIRHGEAVAIGMIVEGKISNRLGLLSSVDLGRLEDIIKNAGLPTKAKVPRLEIGKIIQAMQSDKKVLQGKTRFALPRSIGDVFVTDEVPLSLVKQVLQEA